MSNFARNPLQSAEAEREGPGRVQRVAREDPGEAARQLLGRKQRSSESLRETSGIVSLAFI